MPIAKRDVPFVISSCHESLTQIVAQEIKRWTDGWIVIYLFITRKPRGRGGPLGTCSSLTLTFNHSAWTLDFFLSRRLLDTLNMTISSPFSPGRFDCIARLMSGTPAQVSRVVSFLLLLLWPLLHDSTVRRETTCN